MLQPRSLFCQYESLFTLFTHSLSSHLIPVSYPQDVLVFLKQSKPSFISSGCSLLYTFPLQQRTTGNFPSKEAGEEGKDKILDSSLSLLLFRIIFCYIFTLQMRIIRLKMRFCCVKQFLLLFTELKYYYFNNNFVIFTK